MLMDVSGTYHYITVYMADGKIWRAYSDSNMMPMFQMVKSKSRRHVAQENLQFGASTGIDGALPVRRGWDSQKAPQKRKTSPVDMDHHGTVNPSAIELR